MFIYVVFQGDISNTHV